MSILTLVNMYQYIISKHLPLQRNIVGLQKNIGTKILMMFLGKYFSHAYMVIILSGGELLK